MEYKNIFIDFNDEIWRLNRLKNIVDEIHLTLPKEEILKINSIEDIKGTIIFYWDHKPNEMSKNLVNIIAYDDNDACNVKHFKSQNNQRLICACCNNPPQKEDEEIKEYLNYLYKINN